MSSGAVSWPPGAGEMAGCIRSFDWSATPIGSPQSWAPALRVIVEFMLASPQLATLAVGPKRIFLYNDAAAKHYGEQHPGALGRPLADAFAHEFNRVADFYDRVFAGESLHVPAQPLDPSRSGAEDVFDAYLAPVRDADGAVIAAHMTGFAASEQRRAEIRLRESEERQAFLLKLSDTLRPLEDPVAIKEAAGRSLGVHLRVDRAAYAEFPDADKVVLTEGGYCAAGVEPVDGRHNLDDYADFVSELRQGIVAIARDTQAPSLAASRTHAKQESMLGIRAAVATPLIKSSRLVAALYVHSVEPRDWSEADVALIKEVAERTWSAVERARAEGALRESEGRLGNLLRLMPAAVYTCDTEGRLTFFNRRAVECWGREPQLGEGHDRWCGSFRMWFPDGRPLPHDICPMADAARLGQSFRNTEVVIEQPTGARMVASVNIDPLYDIDGRLTGAINVFEDITKNRRAEAALLESEARLAEELADSDRLQRLSTGLVVEGDVETLYASILEAARLLMRADMASIQELVPERQQLHLLAHHGFTARSAEFWQWVRADTGSSCGRALANDERITVSDMDLFDGHSEDVAAYRHSGILSVQSTPLRAQSGKIVGMLSTHWRERRAFEAADFRLFDVLTRLVADLLERASTERALRESEERLREFGEASQDVLWIRDADTLQWTYLTPAFEAIYGLSREEALSGDNFRSWTELIVPEDRDLAMAAIDRVRQGEHVTFDYRVRRPADGTIRWLRNTDFPITDADGKVALVGGVGHDLTELREAELRLQKLIEGIPQLVWRAVDGGHWTWASPQWTGYTGQPEEDSHGFGWLDTVHPDDRANVMEVWSKAVERGAFEAEYRLRRSDDGHYRWFQTRATPVRDDAGQIMEWLGTSTDVDDLREMQEHQRVMVAELQHRTRNLIGVVRSTSDKTARSSTDLRDFRGRFRDRLDALARAQGLLSRLNSHDRVTFDELIQTELSAMDGSAERLTLNGPEGVRLRSSTVQTLAMALHELATNAVKYGALGQPGGRLAIMWDLEIDGQAGKPWLHIDWHEHGVEMPSPGAAPTGTGQGRELIEQALPYQLSAKTTYTLGPDGVHCTISIPVSVSTVDMEHA